MSQEIRIPDIGDAEDVEVVEILVSAGDQVGADDPVIVIESDKASMEVPSGLAGTIESLAVSVGDKVTQGQVIARIAGESAEAEAEAGEAEAEQAAQPEARERSAEAQAETEAEAEEPAAPPASDGAGRDGSGEQQEIEVAVPDIGEAENVEVIEVAVKPGDHVEENDVLVVVESDKASMEIPANQAGTIKEVHVSVGTQVEQGTRLVTLLSEAAAVGAASGREKAEASRPQDAPTEQAAPTKAASPTEQAAAAKPSAPAQKAPAEEPSAAAEPAAEAGAQRDVYAGPAVRRLARELGVDLTQVNGTGSRGRIVKDDVKSFVKERIGGAAPAAGSGIPALPVVDFSKFGEIEEQPLSRTRASGAQNLHRAWLNIPHVTQHDEVDVSDLEDFRASLKAEAEQRGVKLTPLAFIIKACCHVLKEFPTFNASLDAQAKNFILKRYYHIGMAVDTPDGLVVPVIRNADQKGVWELSAEIAELADKARNKKLGMDDMRGGSFSVSSLGAIGGTGFTPIINAPEVAILGVSRVTVRPVWNGETFVPRKMLPLSLSYDHRAVNGAEAGRFVTRLGEILSDIRRLAL